MTFTPEDYRREARDLREGIASCCLWLPTSPCASCVSDDRLAIMLDAAAEMVQPKTCATCQHWDTRDGVDAAWKTHICTNGHVWAMFYKCKEFTPPADFGCTLWTPREP